MIARVLAIALMTVVAGGCQTISNAEAVAPSGLEIVPLTIVTAKGRHEFKVEVARTQDEQARGLMFRDSIPQGTGMIFPMAPPRPASFWMKNCPVPQDWMFIRADGTIARLIENTVPYSLEPQGTSEPVAAVLEIAGGEAARLGIAEDDRVIWNNAAN
jgi:uncharacterized protein